MPKFSVIFMTYRPGGYDLLADSLAHQTCQDYELIVVDDLPGRREQVTQYLKDKGVKLKAVVPSKKKCFDVAFNLWNVYNTGIMLSEGEYLIFLQDYAWLPPDALSKFERLEPHLKQGLVVTGIGIMLEDTRKRFLDRPISIWDEEDIYLPDHSRPQGVVHSVWTPEELEMFYFCVPYPVLVRTNGMPECYDHATGTSGRYHEQLKRLNIPTYVDHANFCYMYNHREWGKGADEATWWFGNVKPQGSTELVVRENTFNLATHKRGTIEDGRLEGGSAPAEVDIVITTLSYNILKPCIDTIQQSASGLNYRIIIVTEEPDEKLLAYLKLLEGSGNVKLVIGEHRLGTAKALNVGLRNSNAAFVSILNDDVGVAKNWLHNLLAVLKDNPQFGAVSPQLYKKPRGYFAELCGWLITREALNKVGELSEDPIFKDGYGSDVDYVLRFKKAGYDVHGVPDSVIYHVGGLTVHGIEAIETSGYMNHLYKAYGDEVYSDRSRLPVALRSNKETEGTVTEQPVAPQQVRVRFPWIEGGKILEVGGGGQPAFRPNLDMRKLPTVDIVGDLEDRWPVEDESFDGVFGQFVIEHVSWRKVPHFAEQCFRVLKPGGAVMMIGPDTLEQCKEIVRLNKIGVEESALIFGGQEERGWNEHKAAFSPEYVVEVFKKAGFDRVETEPWRGQIWTGAHTDMLIRAWKSQTGAKGVQQVSAGGGEASEEPISARVVFPFKQGGHILEVGGGDQPLFRPNLDIRKLPTVDIVCDLEERWPIEGECFDGVFGKFVIEHIGWRKVPQFVAECFRVLKPGGVAMMIGPNTFEQCKEIIRRGKLGPEENAMLCGNHGLDEKGWNEHKAAFSPEYAVELFKKAGFDRVETENVWLGDGVGPKTDMVIKAWKGGPQAMECPAAPAAVPQQAGLTQQSWYKELEGKMQPQITPQNPQEKKVGLNIGSFTVMTPSTERTQWINCDILDLQAYASEKRYAFQQFDARKGIPRRPATVDFIIASHFLEHLTRQGGNEFLDECFRVLKPGGVLRITVPDTKLIAGAYGNLKTRFFANEGVKDAEDEAEALWNFITAGHVTAYDQAALLVKLEKAGFTVYECRPQDSNSPEIASETVDMYPDHSVYVEGVKPGAPAPQPLSPAVMRTKDMVVVGDRKSLKVGLVSTQFFGTPPKQYGGLEQVVWDLACGLGDLGHEVTLFAPEGSGTPPGGHLVVTGPALQTVNVDWVKAEESAYEIYRKHCAGLDILHGHDWFGFEYQAKTDNPTLKVCHTHHGGLNPGWWLKSKPPYKLNFIAISDHMRLVYAGQGMPSMFVYNGIDMGRYQFQKEKGDHLLFVGRFSTFKQPHVAIEIAKALNMGLALVGGSFVDDPAYLEKIKAMCDKVVKPGEDYYYHGEQVVMYLDASHETKIKLMQDAKCLIFPSAMGEPFGLVAAEAMACGTPVVSTSDGAIGEVVRHGYTGFVCKSVPEMIEAVRKVDIIFPEACHQRVKEMFSRQAMARSYEARYRQILRGEEW